MDRVLLCANPAASGFTGGTHRDVLARLREHFDVESEWPKTPADTRAISAQAAADGVLAVIAMGGDGVVHHVANGIAGTPSALGVIPVGTTNVLARILGVPGRANAAADFLCTSPEPRPSPSARVVLAGPDADESRRATFSVGVGFDAEVVEVAEREPYRKYRFGGIHYARSAISVARERYPGGSAPLRVSDGVRSAEAATVLVQLHPTFTYFGRIPLRFGTHEPGRATVLVASSLDRRRILTLLVRAASGRDLSATDGIDVWDGVTSLAIDNPSATLPAQADGELLGTPDRVTMSVDDRSLLVLAPKP